VQNQHALAC
jgi:hypothetical protein